MVPASFATPPHCGPAAPWHHLSCGGGCVHVVSRHPNLRRLHRPSRALVACATVRAGEHSTSKTRGTTRKWHTTNAPEKNCRNWKRKLPSRRRKRCVPVHGVCSVQLAASHVCGDASHHPLCAASAVCHECCVRRAFVSYVCVCAAAAPRHCFYTSLWLAGPGRAGNIFCGKTRNDGPVKEKHGGSGCAVG